MAEQENTQVKLGDRVVGEIDLPTIDVTPHVGNRVNIAQVTEHESNRFGKKGYYIKVQTDVVATEDGSEGPIEIRGSRLFSLHSDKDGNIGWGPETKTGLFLKSMGVQHYNDLVGKEVMLNLQTNKDGQKFLSFESV